MRDTRINLSHGGGGKAMRALIDDVFARAFGNDATEDQASIPLADLARHGDRLAFTTDSYVVDPLFFPGSDIGALAVAGTVNDLAVGGARPLYCHVAWCWRKACRSKRCNASLTACAAWPIALA